VPLTDEELKSLAESKEASNSSNNKNAGKNNNKKNQQQQQHQKKNKLFSLEKCSEPAAKSFSQLFETPTSVSSGKDNRNIFDDKKDCSQPLRHSDIASLKDQGLTSKEIVQTIVTSSKSFAQKTEFSQEKYLKKKENKYGDVLQFIPIDLHLIADFYFSRDPSKVLGLRADTISQILSYGNIHANGRYLLYENAGGILVAAVLQRLGGFGLLLHCHAGTNPQQQAVAYMNFSKEYLKPMRNLDVFYLIQGRATKNGKEGTEEVVTSTKNPNEVEDVEEQPSAKKSRIEEDGGVDMDVGEEISVAALDEKDDKVGGAGGKPKNNREENEKSLELIETATFDGLIIAGKEHPLTIFQKLLPRLNLSSPFVVYCSYPEVRKNKTLHV
jgi:tRNA (adenine-N(1)-)-methyltransferase non-catalytic subunit